jgi:hypothetical protein
MSNESRSLRVASRLESPARAVTSAALIALIRITPASAAFSRTERAPATPFRKSMRILLSTMRSFDFPSDHRTGQALPAADFQAPK